MSLVMFNFNDLIAMLISQRSEIFGINVQRNYSHARNLKSDLYYRFKLSLYKC